MEKNQKILLKLFLFLFLGLEFIFAPVVSIIPTIFLNKEFTFFYQYFIETQFFLDNPNLLFFFVLLEFFSGIMILYLSRNIKYKFKSLILILLIIFLISLLFSLYFGFVVNNGIGF